MFVGLFMMIWGNLVRSLEAAAELMRMQALTKGVITSKDENGNAYKVDYDIDKSHKGTADFADKDIDPIETIMEWTNMVDQSVGEVTIWNMSRISFNRIKQGDQIQISAGYHVERIMFLVKGIQLMGHR